MTFRHNWANIQSNLIKSANFSYTFFYDHLLKKSATFELFSRKVGRLATVVTLSIIGIYE